MSKEEKVEINKGAGKVAAGIANVLAKVATQGNVITQCVTSIKGVYRGAEVPKADIEFIAETVAKARGWTVKSRGPRMSEVRKIVRNYASITDACNKLAKKLDVFTWHTAMRLVTQLNKDQTVNQAVAAVVSGVNKPAADRPWEQVLKSAVTSIQNIPSRAGKLKAFRVDLAKLLDKHGLNS
jgi:hypothetical protein